MCLRAVLSWLFRILCGLNLHNSEWLKDRCLESTPYIFYDIADAAGSLNSSLVVFLLWQVRQHPTIVARMMTSRTQTETGNNYTSGSHLQLYVTRFGIHYMVQQIREVRNLMRRERWM